MQLFIDVHLVRRECARQELDVHELLGAEGVAQDQQDEQGRVRVSIRQMVSLCMALGLEFDDLLAEDCD